MKIKKWLSLCLLGTVVLSGCNNESSTSNDGTAESTDDTEETDLRVAYSTSPPSLDPHMSTAVATVDIVNPIYETLVGMDSNFEPQPMLADYWEISDDGKTYTFYLREGVLFHNGEEMIAEDVVASLEKWINASPLGLSNFSEADFEIEDDYTITLALPEPNSATLNVLGTPRQFAGIMPKEVAESAGPEGAEEFIGTGPFMLDDWQDSQYYTFKKFDDYSPLDTPADGYIGKKEALVEELRIDIVGDPSTRISGLQTEQYDIAHDLPFDNYDQLESDSTIVTHTHDFFGYAGAFFNKRHGLFSDVKARQAVTYALDMDEILLAAYTSAEFATPTHSLVPEFQTNWYSEAGEDRYNQKDAEKAEELLDEAGYNGEEITFIVSRDYEHHYNAAVAVQQQLENIGMNIELEVYDWSTMLSYREDETAWDLFASSFPYETHPINNIWLDSTAEYPGWTDSPEIDHLIKEIRLTQNEEEAVELFEELQNEFWDYLPFAMYGSYNQFTATLTNVEGYDFVAGPIFWNVSKEEG